MSGIIAQNTLDNSGLIKSVASGSSAWTFIKKLTASSSADLSFVNGSADVVLDGTYAEYIFYWVDIHPQTDDKKFGFQGSTDTGSSYGVTITSAGFDAYHNEGDSAATIAYASDQDLLQSTDLQVFQQDYGNAADQNGAGYLHLFNPASTVFQKHWYSRSTNHHASDYAIDVFRGGYFNTQSAIDAIQFKMDSGNLDDGSIFLHGLTI